MHESEGGNIYVGDHLADTLTAKSLDLPPGAAQVLLLAVHMG